jgi:protein TonB
MFDNLVESTSNAEKNARSLAFFGATAAIWTTVLLTIIIGGIMLYDAKLNADFEKEATLVAAAPPPAPPPPPPQAPQPKVPPPTNVVSNMVATNKEMTEIHKEVVHPPVVNSSPTGTAGSGFNSSDFGAPGGTDLGFGNGPPPPAPPVAPPPPAPPPPAPPPSVTRVSGGVLAGKAVSRVQPPYPPMAKQANISGAVVVEVTVSETGSVISARGVSGHPLLMPAAVAAAKQWRFSPTLLSGVPVKVIGTITFNFTKT